MMRRRALVSGIARWMLLAVLASFIVLCALWRLDGGRWERVETPSMGTTAPVGSLLWVKPVDFSTLRVGDFITFTPPGREDVTYSHQVERINPDGTLRTKGAIPGPDPWSLTADDVVGKVQMTWRGMGWIVAMTPILVIGGLLVGAVRAAVRPTWRAPVVLVGASIVATVAIMLHRPLLNAEQLAWSQPDATRASVTYVGTGMLPVQLRAPGQDQIVLGPGEVGTVVLATDASRDRQVIEIHPAVTGWWIVIVVGCLLPGLRSWLVRRRLEKARRD